MFAIMVLEFEPSVGAGGQFLDKSSVKDSVLMSPGDEIVDGVEGIMGGGACARPQETAEGGGGGGHWGGGGGGSCWGASDGCVGSDNVEASVEVGKFECCSDRLSSTH